MTKNKNAKTAGTKVGAKVVTQLKSAQKQFQSALKDRRKWMDEAKVYAEKQGKELKKLLATDVNKVKKFIEKERTQLERFQKKLPGELEILRKYMDKQKKEFEKLLKALKKGSGTQGRRPKTVRAKKVQTVASNASRSTATPPPAPSTSSSPSQES